MEFACNMSYLMQAKTHSLKHFLSAPVLKPLRRQIYLEIRLALTREVWILYLNYYNKRN